MPPELPAPGRIVSYSPLDEVGRIELTDGTLVRFGRSSCMFEPVDGIDVQVEQVEPHRLGGLKGTAVRLAPTARSAYEAALSELPQRVVEVQHPGAGGPTERAAEQAPPPPSIWKRLQRLVGLGSKEPPPGPNQAQLRGKENAHVAEFSRKTQLAVLPLVSASRVLANDCPNLVTIPPGLSCNELHLARSAVQKLPEDLQVRYRLDLTDCTELVSLPPNLSVGALVLNGCTGLKALPEGLSAAFLDLNGCSALTDLPASLRVRAGRLSLRDCAGLTALPSGLGPLAQLDLSGCANLCQLPKDLLVTGWIDLANTGLAALPATLAHTQLRWRGVLIDARIAFEPQTISAEEALAETNTERRRVLIERMGFDRFVEQARAELVDQDKDAGGLRRLMRVQLEGDEDLVCIAVQCPSTGRQYVLRVPPATRSCRHAAAWLAGFDQPDQYQPTLET